MPAESSVGLSSIRERANICVPRTIASRRPLPHILKDTTMKDWNKTGKIKAIILGILFLPNLIKPIGAQPDFGFTMIIVPNPN